VKISRRIEECYRGKVALVTGAGSGIGLALTEGLAAAGARVYAIECEQEALVRCEAAAGTVVGCRLDVTEWEAYQELVRVILEEEGAIDHLFNNAGVTLLGEAHKVEFERWKWLLDTNVMGVVNGIALVYPGMAERGGGHIVNTASIAGGTGYATAAAYTASKACVLEITRSLRAEARGLGVRVSAACPGYVRTGIFRQERTVGADVEEVMDDFPTGMLEPDEAGVRILTGVARGRETIVFPLSARFFWALAAWAPALLRPVQRRLLRQFRG
jgi:NADP-dependent 3-hydroxy acid dehydrogenase YdfG